MKRKFLCFLLLIALSIADITAEDRMSYYLFSYFTDNSTHGQQVNYAVSKNGLDFEPLNGAAPVLSSDTISLSGGVRDPHILRCDDGWFCMVLNGSVIHISKKAYKRLLRAFRK